MNIALITGINGQDGSYMAELLLEKDYQVHGIIRRASNFNTKRIDHILTKIKLHYGDVTDMGNILQIISTVKPTEIYNFAAMSHVKVSFEIEQYTFQTNTIGILNILQVVKLLGLEKTTKIYQASTSEMYGNSTDGNTLLHENSVMDPVSPYGISKLAAHLICNYYRDAYSMFIVSSILLNHESERRGATFVTKKIADYVGKYFYNNNIEPLQIGNLESRRDWGYAKDYVYGIWQMMQYPTPDNYVLATGETHSVREFIELAFHQINITIEWKGVRGSNTEYGIDTNSKKVLIQVNDTYYRPIDIDTLIGDPSKAQHNLKWKSTVSFPNLVKIMVSHVLKELSPN